MDAEQNYAMRKDLEKVARQAARGDRALVKAVNFNRFWIVTLLFWVLVLLVSNIALWVTR